MQNLLCGTLMPRIHLGPAVWCKSEHNQHALPAAARVRLLHPVSAARLRIWRSSADGFFCSDDGQAFAALTRCERTGYFGVECMRRRVDSVWTLTRPNANLMRYADAMTVLEQELVSGRPPLPVPPGEPVRPVLAKLGPKGASAPFQLLSSPSHHPAAWAINQVYLAFPRPDRHWARDFQTGNFHTRLWETYLLACFREQGCLVKQDHPSPDFWIGRRGHGHAWIEAVGTHRCMNCGSN